MAYRDEVLADSPVEYWEMNETSGSTVASVGSGAHSGTATGTTIVIGTGHVGNARAYNGTSDHISCPSVTDFAAGSTYSLEGWFKASTSDTTGKDWLTVIRRDGSGVAILVRVAGSTSGIQQGAVQTYLNGRIVSTGSTRFDDNNWHHIVVTKSGSTVRLYVDATEYTTASGSLTSGGTGTANPVYIGASGGSSERFRGQLDDVAIYTTALSAARISAHFNPPVAISINSGLQKNLVLAGLGATIVKTSSSKVVSSGLQRNMTLSGNDATVVLGEPIPEQIVWFFETVLANASVDATNHTASLETTNAVKRNRLVVKSLVRAQ